MPFLWIGFGGLGVLLLGFMVKETVTQVLGFLVDEFWVKRRAARKRPHKKKHG